MLWVDLYPLLQQTVFLEERLDCDQSFSFSSELWDDVKYNTVYLVAHVGPTDIYQSPQSPVESNEKIFIKELLDPT